MPSGPSMLGESELARLSKVVQIGQTSSSNEWDGMDKSSR